MKRQIISSALALSLVLGGAAALPEGVFSESLISVKADDAVKKIALGNTITDIIPDGSANSYQFTTTQDGYVQIEFIKGDIEGYEKGWSVDVYDSKDTKLMGTWIVGDTPKDLAALGLPKGTYKVEVGRCYAWDRMGSQYKMTVNFKASSKWEKEANEDITQATTAALDSTYGGALSYGSKSEQDFFKYSIPSSGYYRLFFGKDFDSAERGWEVTFYDSYGQSLESTNIYAGTTKTETYDIKLNKGTAYIRVTSLGYEDFPRATYKLRLIKTIPLSGGKLKLNKTSAAYTGKTIKPTTTVKVGGTTLKKGTDYRVTFTNCKNIGKATVTVTGIGKYRGTLTKTFKIVPKKTTIKKVTSPKTKQLKVTYKKNANATGYQITYSTSKKFTKKTTKNTTVKSATTLNKTIKKLKKGKTYYVKVRAYKTVGSTKYYGAYSAVKKVKVK
ncbi:MAG: hypothetical protein IJ696_05515 [Ruminococcus sp.]|nr:hypothetical protein [Ruminococcus sp.]